MTILPIYSKIQITTLKFSKRSVIVRILNFISEKQIWRRPPHWRCSISPNFCHRVGANERDDATSSSLSTTTGTLRQVKIENRHTLSLT